MILLLICALGFVMALCGTALMRSYAIHSHLLDVPNTRSSHTTPTPRGGGVAFVTVFLTLLVVAFFFYYLSLPVTLAFVSAGFMVALIGFLDDRYQLPARWRFLCHIAASCGVLLFLGGAPQLSLFGWLLPASPWMLPLFTLLIAWLLNLFNFMDGIDGIAASQAVLVAGFGAGLWWLTDPSGNWPAALLFACCVAGFLPWNLPPARIFMGDAGSGFLGFVVACLAIESSRANPHMLWVWLILANGFVIDASVTLITRFITGQRVNEAHRNHAYQHLAQRLKSHRPVTAAYSAAVVFWLLPIAWLVCRAGLDGSLGWFISAVPLALMAVWCRAGRA